MIYILYGQPASGKTTLGKLLAKSLETPFLIDGDEFREMFTNKNYGRDGREENIRNANAVVTYLNKKGQNNDWMCIYVRDEKDENHIDGVTVNNETDVVMCLVNPYEHLRKELKNNNKDEVVEILLESTRDLRREYHVDDFEGGGPDHVLNTDNDVEETWDKLQEMLKL